MKRSDRRTLCWIFRKLSLVRMVAYSMNKDYSSFAWFRLLSCIYIFLSTMVKKFMISCLLLCSILKIWVPWSNKLQEKPTFTEVSILSPVSIQNLIPASLMAVMVSGALSYNLSSIAVAPRRLNSLSISETTFLILSSLWLIADFAYSLLVYPAAIEALGDRSLHDHHGSEHPWVFV